MTKRQRVLAKRVRDNLRPSPESSRYVVFWCMHVLQAHPRVRPAQAMRVRGVRQRLREGKTMTDQPEEKTPVDPIDLPAVTEAATRIRDALVLGDPEEGLNGLPPELVDERKMLLRRSVLAVLAKNEAAMLLNFVKVLEGRIMAMINQANGLLGNAQAPHRYELRSVDLMTLAANEAAQRKRGPIIPGGDSIPDGMPIP